MSDELRYVVIGAGPAGDQAARYLRERDPAGRITMITASKLPFIRRADLYQVFEGMEDWRSLLVHPTSYYEEQRIVLRRSTLVVRVDPDTRQVGLQHRESMSFDKLLIASGGGGYVPESLRPYAGLITRFGTFEDALSMRRALPVNGRVIVLGGDMMGIDLARKLVRFDFEVTLLVGEQLFWPHQVDKDQLPTLLEGLRNMGLEVIQGNRVTCIEEGPAGMRARRVICDDGSTHTADVVLCFAGLAPQLGYLAAAGLHIQRGLMVDTFLATADAHIWAAGDVCQIWIPEENRYRYSYQWHDVQEMGRIAACNMTGGHEAFSSESGEYLRVNSDGDLESSMWVYN